jgi:hypothetical protein
MPISNLLYDRPDLDQDRGLLPLYITGTLPEYVVRAAYEGRQHIHNAIGACRVDQIAGDTLPLGSQIWVDQATQQIVVTWPAYSEDETPLENPGFEQGDTGGWSITTRGEREGYPVTAIASGDRPHAGQYSAYWLGNQGYGHARGVEAVLGNRTHGQCYPMQQVTASAWIALDDTESSQNRGYKTYTIPPESITTSAQFHEGALTVVAGYLTYTIPAEGITVAAAFHEGALTNA